jgi:hypothetical protein
MNKRWADIAGQFDHTLIYMQPLSREAGTGSAGACQNRYREHPAPRLRVDMGLVKANSYRDDFAMTVSEEIKAYLRKVHILSPFETLTAVNEILSRVTQHMAPRVLWYLNSGLQQRIFVCVQPCSTTLFGLPFPLPTPQGAGISSSGSSPRPRFEGCARHPSGQEAKSANLFRKECQGCNEARKPSCPAPQLNLPRRLSPPSHGSADRRLRPVRCSSVQVGC